MWAAMGRWMVLASCVLAAVSATQDNVLRFLNHKETVRMAQQKHSDEVKVFASGFEGDLPMEKEKQSPAALSASVICPGGKYKCPSGDTCCQLASGRWGCCPHLNAVCCSDHIHCCPHGYLCQSERCLRSNGQDSLPWSVKTPAVPREEEVMAVKCPDGSECANGNTCCLLLDGKYGCCPYPKAVCCKDKKHCCPNGYICDVQAQTCNKSATVVPFLVQKAAVSNVQSVICPDGSSECPDGSTCCRMSGGQYGCCPQPNAVCCTDGIHCCPEGCTCDLVHQTCKKGQEFIPWVEKVPSPKRVQSVICPDGQSECPDGNTCCKLSSGQYGCCPLPDAVCCSDGIHCCPQNTTCNVAQQTCDHGHYSIPWAKKLPARHRVQSVICPDGQSQCPDGNTCCKLSSGAYGCCPLPDAVCCSDFIHCCPQNTTCNTAQQTCDHGHYSIPWAKKLPARHSVP